MRKMGARPRTHNREQDASRGIGNGTLHRAHIKYPVEGARHNFIPQDVIRHRR